MQLDIGFIGLGAMGGPMASNLQKAGHRLVVNDVNRASAASHIAAGAAWADTPEAVARGAEIVFTSLPGPADVEAVVLGDRGLVHGLRPNAAVFDLSTNSPSMVRKIHAVLAEKQMHLLDAPISGGPQGAVTGKLSLWVGGTQSIFDRYKPVLDAMGDQASFVGPIGAGSIAKLVHNLAGQSIQAILAEVFTLGVKAGLDPLPLFQAVEQGMVGRRKTFDGLIPVFGSKFDPPPAVFALKLAHKDIALAAALGRELGVPMRLSSLVLEEMTEALNRGWGGRASQVTTLLQQERAGVSLAVDAEELRKARSA